MNKVDFRKLSKEIQAEMRRRAIRSYLSMGRKNKLKLSKMYDVIQNTITEIPDEEYKELKIAAIRADISVKDYVLDALRLKAKILTHDDAHLQEGKEVKSIAKFELEENS
jgi:hypothetical protein